MAKVVIDLGMTLAVMEGGKPTVIANAKVFARRRRCLCQEWRSPSTPSQAVMNPKTPLFSQTLHRTQI